MAYALKQKKGLSIVAACAKKDKQWALQVLGNPALVDNEKLADPNGVDQLGWTALHYAAAHDWQDLVEALLAKGANIEGQGTFGASPLHVAAQNNRLDMIKLLVKRGAQVDARDVGGRTALLEAARFDRGEVARVLLQLGADRSAKSEEGLDVRTQSLRAGGTVAKILDEK